MLRHGLEGLRQIALNKLLATNKNADEVDRVMEAKLLLCGAQPYRYTGVLFGKTELDRPDAARVVSIFADNHSSWEQVALTTFHELGHVVAPWDMRHGAEWRDACFRLGLYTPPPEHSRILNLEAHMRTGFTCMSFCDNEVKRCIADWEQEQPKIFLPMRIIP